MEKTQHLIFDTAPFPMWIYDIASLKFLAVNREAIHQYGYSEQEFLSMTIKDIRPAEDIPLLEEAITNIHDRKEPVKTSLFRHTRKDGSVLQVQLKGNLIEYNGRKAEIITAVDYTEVYEKEQRIERQKKYLELIAKINHIFLEEENWRIALQRSFQEMIAVLEFDRIWHTQKGDTSKENSVEVFAHSCDDCILTKSRNHELCSVLHNNHEMLELLESKEIINYNIRNLPDSDLKKSLKKQGIQSILLYPVENNKEYSGCIALVDHNIERNWIDRDFKLLSVLSSNLTKAFEKEKIQLKLLQSEKKFRSMVQNGSELITIMDEHGVLTYASPTSLKLFGLPEHKFHRTNIFDYVHPEDIHQVKKAIQNVMQGKRVTVPYFRIINNHKITYIRSVLTNLMKDPSVNGIVANSTDVTNEVEQQQESLLLLKLSKVIGQPGSVTDSLKLGIIELMKFSQTIMGEFWIKSSDNSRLDLVVNHCTNECDKTFNEASRYITSFPLGLGLPGAVGKAGKSVLWIDLPNNQMFSRHNAAGLSGFVMALGIPIFFNDEFLGAFLLFSKDKNHPFQQQQAIYEDIGKNIGSVLKQKLLEEEYSGFFNMSPSVQCILNTHGDILKSNHTCSELLHMEEDKIVGNNVYNFIDKQDHALFKDALNTMSSSTDKITFEARIKDGEDNQRWLLWSIVIQPHKKLFYVVGKDISEQKITDEQLKHANNLLIKAQELAKLGYWRNHLVSGKIEWSEETYKIFELDRATFTPTLPSIRLMLHPEDRHYVENNPANVFTPGEVQTVEYRIITGNGKVRWLKQEMKYSTDEKGNPLLLEGTIQDITEAKHQLKYIEEQNKKLKEIAWMQSHVLRAPLVRMMGAIDIIKDIPAKNMETKNLFDAVLKSADEMDRVIHDITEKTRIIEEL